MGKTTQKVSCSTYHKDAVRACFEASANCHFSGDDAGAKEFLAQARKHIAWLRERPVQK